MSDNKLAAAMLRDGYYNDGLGYTGDEIDAMAAELEALALEQQAVDESELVEAALVDSSDAWTDEDARKPWGCEIAFLRHLANYQYVVLFPSIHED